MADGWTGRFSAFMYKQLFLYLGIYSECWMSGENKNFARSILLVRADNEGTENKTLNLW